MKTHQKKNFDKVFSFQCYFAPCLMSFHQGLAKSSHRNQDHAKNWKNQNFKTFPIKCLTVTMQPPKPRSCQKLAKSIFQYFFQGKNNRKKQPLNPRSYTKNSKLWRLDFNFRNLSLSLGQLYFSLLCVPLWSLHPKIDFINVH